MEIQRYQTTDGLTPITRWLDCLRDGVTRARIVARLDRLGARLRSDWRKVGGGLCELRIDHGPDAACILGNAARS